MFVSYKTSYIRDFPTDDRLFIDVELNHEWGVIYIADVRKRFEWLLAKQNLEVFKAHLLTSPGSSVSMPFEEFRDIFWEHRLMQVVEAIIDLKRPNER